VSNPVDDEKAALRRLIQARRQGLEPAYVARASRAVCDIVCESPEFARAHTIALYSAISGEVSVRRVFDAAIAAAKRCVLPRCCPGGVLEFAAVESWGALSAGTLGILEPDPALPALELGEGDLAIVPGVAFDRSGGRLGRGRGYYDRSFPTGDRAGCTLFGVGFSLQLVDEVPIGSLDRCMDAVISESGMLRAPQ